MQPRYQQQNKKTYREWEWSVEAMTISWDPRWEPGNEGMLRGVKLLSWSAIFLKNLTIVKEYFDLLLYIRTKEWRNINETGCSGLCYGLSKAEKSREEEGTSERCRGDDALKWGEIRDTWVWINANDFFFLLVGRCFLWSPTS